MIDCCPQHILFPTTGDRDFSLISVIFPDGRWWQRKRTRQPKLDYFCTFKDFGHFLDNIIRLTWTLDWTWFGKFPNLTPLIPTNPAPPPRTHTHTCIRWISSLMERTSAAQPVSLLSFALACSAIFCSQSSSVPPPSASRAIMAARRCSRSAIWPAHTPSPTPVWKETQGSGYRSLGDEATERRFEPLRLSLFAPALGLPAVGGSGRAQENFPVPFRSRTSGSEG